MKPETRKRLWIIAAVLSLWLSSLFVWQTIAADPRYTTTDVLGLEFLLCFLAVLVGIVSLVLHTRKSLKGLVLSIIILTAAVACLLNTQVATLIIYGDYTTPGTDITIDGVGPARLFFADAYSERTLFAELRIGAADVSNIKDIRLFARYEDLLGRSIYCDGNLNAVDYNKDWNFKLPSCLSGKKMRVWIYVTTADGKRYETYLTIKAPKKPIWSK